MGLNLDSLPDDHPIKKQADKKMRQQDFTSAKKKLLKKTKSSGKPHNFESLLQQRAIEFFRLKYPKFKRNLFAIPNGGHRNKAVAGRMKAEGVLAGVWDLMLTVPRGQWAGCFIETKWGKNGLTDSQKAFRCSNEKFYYFLVYRSLDEFEQKIEKYLSLKS